MTQRTLNRSLIIHKDLALGPGTAVQVRGTNTSTEQKIELTFIFRTIDEIRNLDFALYTRVYLHTLGPPVEYYFNSASAVADNAKEILAPVPAVALGRWLKIGPAAPNYVTADFTDLSHAVNTTQAKQAGYMVWSSTLNKPLWAVGSVDSDNWVDATGATVHTPI